MKKSIGNHIFILGLTLLTVALFCVGCSGNDGDDKTPPAAISGDMPPAASGGDPLSVPSKIGVVEAESTPSPSIHGLFSVKRTNQVLASTSVNVGSFEASSDYNMDKTSVYTHEEESSMVFKMINMILCSINQTKYGEFMNKGAYRAMINPAKCSDDMDSPSNKGASSKDKSSVSSRRVNYEEWIVDSSREPDQPHIIKLWMKNDEDGFQSMLYAKTSVYQSPNADNPYGYLRVDFTAHPVVNGTVLASHSIYKGYMRTLKEKETGDVTLQFYDSFGASATYKRSSDGLSGGGTMAGMHCDFSKKEQVCEPQTLRVAFDQNHMRGSKGSGEICLDRSNFKETAWSYALYNSTGDRLKLNTGFPVKHIEDNGKIHQGWVDSWGVYMDDGFELASGDILKRANWIKSASGELIVQEDGGDYTLFIADGRLKKHVKKTVALRELKNVPLQWSDTNTNKEYKVEWNGSDLMKTAELLDNGGIWIWTKLDASAAIDLSSEGYTFDFWSNGLNDYGSFELKDGDNNFLAPSDDTQVVFRVSDLVYSAADATDNLSCFRNCPDPYFIDNDGHFLNLYYFMTPSEFTSRLHRYTFSDDMTLRHNNSPVIKSNEIEGFSRSTVSGVLFEANAEAIDKLKCVSNNMEICQWKAREELDVYYTWETGVDQWNKFTAIKDENDSLVRFDEPLTIEYENGLGTKYWLEYFGYGELYGIPFHCADSEGKEIECDFTTRWTPKFSIGAGVEVRNTNDSSVYIVKPLEIERELNAVPTSNCSNLTLPNYALPKKDIWQNPNIGDMPEVTDPPAVIGGVIQGSNLSD